MSDLINFRSCILQDDKGDYYIPVSKNVIKFAGYDTLTDLQVYTRKPRWMK